LLLSRLKRFKTALQAYSRTNTELWTPPDGCWADLSALGPHYGVAF
jgi:hypothetical protein